MRMQPGGLERNLDISIKAQYHQICFNPNKRDILLRLTEKSQDIISQGFYIPKNPNTAIDNRIINQYVQSVYHKYNIEDPIQKQFRLSTGRESKIFKQSLHTPQKNIDPIYVSYSTRSSKTKKKLAQLKDNYLKGTQDVVISSQYSQKNTERASSHSKQIGYRTKQKISFKASFATSDQQLYHNRHELNLSQIQSTSIAIKLNPTNQVQRHGEVPVIFRYCPMCEEAVLEHNISYHQSICTQIHQGYKMSYEQLELLISSKIQRMQRDIEEAFINQNQTAFMKEYLKTKQQVQNWLKKQQHINYDQLKSSFSNLAIDVYHQLTKLNWFRSLHTKIVQQKQRQIATQ